MSMILFFQIFLNYLIIFNYSIYSSNGRLDVIIVNSKKILLVYVLCLMKLDELDMQYTAGEARMSL